MLRESGAHGQENPDAGFGNPFHQSKGTCIKTVSLFTGYLPRGQGVQVKKLREGWKQAWLSWPRCWKNIWGSYSINGHGHLVPRKDGWISEISWSVKRVENVLHRKLNFMRAFAVECVCFFNLVLRLRECCAHGQQNPGVRFRKIFDWINRTLVKTSTLRHYLQARYTFLPHGQDVQAKKLREGGKQVWLSWIR